MIALFDVGRVRERLLRHRARAPWPHAFTHDLVIGEDVALDPAETVHQLADDVDVAVAPPLAVGDDVDARLLLHADDVAHRVVHALAREAGIAVVGEASSGEEALRLARERLPDLVLLDISMPGWDGLVTAQRIATACPASAIVVLTASEDPDRLLGAFKAGARGYVLKGVGVQELARVIRGAVAGEVYVSPSLAA